MKNSLVSIKRIVEEKIVVPLKIGFIKKILRKNYQMVNIGGGTFYRKHWNVLDYPIGHYNYKSKNIDIIFDLTSNRSLPFKDNQAKFFYSSHTFEHIPQEYCQFIFNEIFRSLKKSGGVRITLPDFDKAYSAFEKNNLDFFKGDDGNNIKEKFFNFFGTYFMNIVSNDEFEKNFKTMKKSELADYYTQKIPRESQKDHSGYHINWWNFDKAMKMLYKAGFKKIYRSSPQKSQFLEMRGVGRQCGFDSTFPMISVFIEAKK